LDSVLHSLDERAIDVGTYLTERSVPGSVDGQPARCPVCLGELALACEPSDGARHFKHRAHADEARCPLTTASWQPEGMVVRHLRDVETTRRHRGQFVDHWQYHYHAMQQLAPSLTIKRFVHLIEYADVLNLWSYWKLQQHDVPYVLLALAEFMIQREQAGALTWVRFCFDGSVRDVGDLWSLQARPPFFFRMVYREPPLTPFPTARQLLHCETVVRDDTVLDGPMPHLRHASAREFECLLGTALRTGERSDHSQAAPRAVR
jgi:hypothetical protein